MHDMPNISFASGGDADSSDFVAYVAKDHAGFRCGRTECPPKKLTYYSTSRTIVAGFLLGDAVKLLDTLPILVTKVVKLSVSFNATDFTNIGGLRRFAYYVEVDCITTLVFFTDQVLLRARVREGTCTGRHHHHRSGIRTQVRNYYPVVESSYYCF